MDMFRTAALLTTAMTKRSSLRTLCALKTICSLSILVLFMPYNSSSQFYQQGGKLYGSGTVGCAGQGSALALSSDGNTALVGAPNDNSDDGATFVFTRSGVVWTQQGTKLVGTGAVGKSRQGGAVSLSADGNTALVGGENDNNGIGGAWVFTRTGSVWSQQGTKLVGGDVVGAANQGYAVALSADGNTAIISGYHDNGNIGAVWIFTRSAGVWTQQGTKLIGSGAVGTAYQGSSVSLSSDGNTAAVGGFIDNFNVGASWIFTRTGGVWTQQGNKLVGTGGVGNIWQGWSNALSGDGNTLIVGGMLDSNSRGAAWIFTRSGDVWTQQGSKLVGTGFNGSTAQGYSVGISLDGNTAMVGAPYDSSNRGAAWMFKRSSGVWSQQGNRLVGTAWTGNAFQGRAVALASDGLTAISGGPWDNGNAGASWVFINSSGVWSQQGSKLVGSGAIATNVHFGTSSALSSDGNLALVGASNDNTGTGAVWVFSRSGTTWTQQGNKLVGSGAIGSSHQGVSTALSADGSTALIGGAFDNTNVGAAWVFTRTGGLWTQQGSKLVGTGNSGAPRQGWAVALSADGNTAIVGGWADNYPQGAAWVFTRSGTTWTQQGNKLVGTGGIGAQQGYSVALSDDGNTAIVGGYQDNSSVGAVWIFVRSGGVWTQQGTKLVGSGAIGTPHQGSSVALSSDGNTALVGGYYDSSGVGATWVYTRSAGIWTQQGHKLVGAGAVGNAYRGKSVSLSGDGNVAVIGGYADNNSVGALWVFVRSNGVWSQCGNKLLVPEATSPAGLGYSVSLSRDGSTVIAGADRNDLNAGAAWVFVSEPKPIISAINDIPEDQGGKVRIIWNRSLRDAQGSIPQVTSYAVWRRVHDGTSTILTPPGMLMSRINTANAVYDFLASVPAVQFDSYAYVAPTLADSTLAGPKYFTFAVSAHTADPSVVYFSLPDSGYSVDNIAPCTPTNPQIVPLANESVRIIWDRNGADPDLRAYVIYRSTLDGFLVGPSTQFAATRDTVFVDSTAITGQTYFYRITAEDIHDNQSIPTMQLSSGGGTGTSAPEDLPTEFALQQNYPNPFNPTTVIRYQVPALKEAKGSVVSVKIYDLLGCEVAILVQEEKRPGTYNVTWNAEGMPSGIYFCTMQAGGERRTRKLVLLQ